MSLGFRCRDTGGSSSPFGDLFVVSDSEYSYYLVAFGGFGIEVRIEEKTQEYCGYAVVVF